MTEVRVDQSVKYRVEEGATPSPSRYCLEHAGHFLEVETRDVGLGYVARLFVDGELQDEQKAHSERAELHADAFTVRVKWHDFAGVKTCVLVSPGGNAIPFEPPRGSHAARMAQFGRKRPTLYAARHVVKPVLQALLPLLGLGALLTALLPRIDWNWVPAFIRNRFLDDGPDWFDPIVNSPVFGVGKWLVPIIIGLLIAVEELEKRKKRKTHKEEYRGPHR